MATINLRGETYKDYCGESDLEVTDCDCEKCFKLRSQAYAKDNQ